MGYKSFGQLRHNQQVRYRGHFRSVAAYFQSFPGVPQALRRRGGEPIPIVLGRARLYVNCHGKKRFVLALSYDGDEQYRYIVATDMTWRALDIVQARSLRWLIEVFFEDWKAHHGWAKLAKQPGEEGSVRGASPDISYSDRAEWINSHMIKSLGSDCDGRLKVQTVTEAEFNIAI